MTFVRLAFLTPALAVVAFACSPANEDGGGEGEGEPLPGCTEPAEVLCQDQTFQALAMSDTASTRSITDTESGGVHDVEVDSTAGGFQGTEGFIYGKFTDDGFEKVTIDDYSSFASMDWDIGFRRFVVRLNSGFGGPSCVGAANVGADPFDDVTEVPEPSAFLADDAFMNDACVMQPDGSGLPTSPSVALQNYWRYPTGCVQMTTNVYVIALADGRAVKMQVYGYYDPLTAQDECDNEGSLPNSYTSGIFRFRWAFM